MYINITKAITIIICLTIQQDPSCSGFSEDCSGTTDHRDIEMNNRGTSSVLGNIMAHNPEPQYDVILEEHLNCPSRPIRDSIISDKSHSWSGYLMKNLLIKPLVNTLDIYNRCVNMVFNDHQANKSNFYGLFAVEYFGIPKDVITSFYNERLPAYYDHIVNYLTTYYTDMFSFQFVERKHYLPSYERLIQMMTSGSPSSSGLKYRDESKIIFEIPGIRQLSAKLFKGFHFSITGATVNLLERKITFHSCLEESFCYYYDSNSPKYKFAVADFVNGVGTSILFWIHPKSHFHSTDLFAYACLKTSNASNLNKILCHHSKHTLFLNDDVLRSTKLPLENSESMFAKYLYPLASHPFYSSTIPTLLSEQLVGKPCQGIPCFNKYSKFDMILKGYFEITRKFVTKIKQHLEKKELDVLLNIINEEKIDFCDGLDVYDLLAAYIYKTSFYHSIDHYTAYMMFTYGQLLSRKYFPNTKIQNDIPISVSVFNKRIEDISDHDTLETVNDLRYSYSYEATCLLFMKYFVNKEMPFNNPSMLNLNYSFDDSSVLNQLTQSYLDDLKQYERQLEVTGDILAPLSMISPSISF